MVHRRQAVDVVLLVTQLAGFIVLVSLYFPAVRRALAGLGLIAVCLSMLVVLGLIGFSVYRLATRPGQAMTDNPFARSNNAPDNDERTATSPSLLEPSLRRRYPWRHEIADPS